MTKIAFKSKKNPFFHLEKTMGTKYTPAVLPCKTMQRGICHGEFAGKTGILLAMRRLVCTI